MPAPGSGTLLQALHRQLRAAIVEGRLAPGLRLPASRVLATMVGVSRSTATGVYDLLLSEGHVEARQGSGTFVAARAATTTSTPHTHDSVPSHKLAAAWRDAGSASAAPATAPRFDFRTGYPDQRRFPFDVWRRLASRALRAAARTSGAGSDPQGGPRLREAIAHHVSHTRAVACDADAVVVTAGAQQAFDLLVRILVTSGRTAVALENPGYPPLHAAFERAGARLHDIGIDAHGLCVDQLPPRVDVIAVSPSHQSPLGVAMSAARRHALLAHARTHDALVIEDDYDGEFRLGGRPLDALQTLDRGQRVFYVGTFAKSMFMALRIGFAVAPPWAVPALVAARLRHNWHVPAVNQATLASFIAEGHLARHVRKMRALYAERHATLLEALQQHLPDRLAPVPSLAGLHLSAAVRAPDRAARWQAAAARADIRIATLAPSARPPLVLNGLVFGYGLIESADIEPGIRALAQAVRRP
ncbi:PLP-dependent aminotransferase family protein [Rhizobacter sp. Root16D2]|uniref:MocR-like pyridoxine biosynthesis transcription factor PdxR n=1 Tax=Rhizobacter sp. Root16D2 TaxID=1736479 RepID=UPI001F308F50|nr:PLP-dependent aminotransferase family protein [Rhizobacter sp. Root16D2]